VGRLAGPQLRQVIEKGAVETLVVPLRLNAPSAKAFAVKSARA